jgi:hypothetical protein
MPGHRPLATSFSRVSPAAPDSGSPASSAGGRASAALRYLDVVLVVLAAAPALALGAPALGYAIGAGGWIVQRVLAQLDKRWVGKAAEPRAQLGFNLFEAFGRIWLLAGAIVLAALVGGRADGLTAAVVIFCAYSVAFAIRVLSGPPAKPQSRSAR